MDILIILLVGIFVIGSCLLYYFVSGFYFWNHIDDIDYAIECFTECFYSDLENINEIKEETENLTKKVKKLEKEIKKLKERNGD